MTGRELGDRSSIDHERSVGDVSLDGADVEPIEPGELRVVAWPAPVELWQPSEVGRERPEPLEQPFDEGVLVIDPEQALVARSRPSVVVRSAPPGAEQNEPAPWVG